MSKIGDLLTGAVGALAANSAGQVFSALFMTGRSIGGIIPDVTIEETHTDKLTTTKHPVERGAAVTDHAYKEPSLVTMRVAWSDSNTLIRSVVSGSLFSGTINSANDLYKQMLDLQTSDQRFDLVTGKRTYSDMLLLQVRNTTDPSSENSLHLELEMEQQLVVQTSEVTLVQTDTQADPAATGAVQNAGTKQPIKAQAQSALSILFGD